MQKKLTPMMEQYETIKRAHEDKLLFYRLGDFYELFFDDAIVASRELNLTLTGRNAGMDEKAPMCGVPYHAAEGYILRLIKKGYKVAICEQVEDPKVAKGIVKRDVIRVITPGTVLAEAGMEGEQNNYLAFYDKGALLSVLLFADVSTGQVVWTTFLPSDAATLIDVMALYRPSELIVCGEEVVPEEAAEYFASQLGSMLISPMKADLVSSKDASERAFQHYRTEEKLPEEVLTVLGYLLVYLEEEIKVAPDHMTQLEKLKREERMLLDASALRHLEITRNLRDGSKRGTLLDVVDRTMTPMGARLLRQWVEQPLMDVHAISKRQDAIGELVDSLSIRSELGTALRTIYDFERLLTRIDTGTASPRDLVALRESLASLPALKEVLCELQALLLVESNHQTQLHSELKALLQRALKVEPAISLKDGGVIADGYSEELDELRSLATNSQEWLQRLEEEIKEKTGLKLKTGYNKVFGYYFEVTHAQAEKVPDYFIRKQTLTNGERYITPELKEFEIKMLSAKDRIIDLEQQLFQELRQSIREELAPVQETARAIAVVDALRSLAEVAYEGRYVRPTLTRNGRILIKDGRHPVIEKFLEREVYVPNDTDMDHQDQEVILITGPNMAGKSTYMRQVAILMILAQIGSFLPCQEASISPVDRIFTRVGASDDISTGQSTFMVEMMEVAYILSHATSNSLVVLDEIGRGTSTFDGLSIARAVVEYMVKHIHAKTLFATHYHELIDLEQEYSVVKNYTVAVKEKGKDVLFLRRIVRGGADRSYGIHVAKLAGLPKKVLDRATEVLAHLEAENPQEKRTVALPVKVAEEEAMMGDLFQDSVLDRLRRLDVMTMTPLEAMNTLYSLQEEVKKGDGK